MTSPTLEDLGMVPAKLDMLVSEIKSAMEGVTPGPWERQENDHSEFTDVNAGKNHLCRVRWRRDVQGNAHRDASFIALMNPVTVRTLLSALEAERQRADKAQAEVTSLRNALSDAEGDIETLFEAAWNAYEAWDAEAPISDEMLRIGDLVAARSVS